jgi:glycine C-acetyltransferase/8-amino-7-oxononanoate synthase
LADKIKRNVRISAGASPPPIPAAAAAGAGLRILSEHPDMRRDLWRNVLRVRDGLRDLGLDIADSVVPIVHVPGGPPLDLLRTKERLGEAGIVVPHVPPNGYSDAPDVESLRIAVFSTHTDDQIDRLISTLGRSL